MPDSPATLDNLIFYVRALHPNGDPLTRLSDAVVVANDIEDNADALVGFFVDQARSTGASWSQIGSSMGVTKQAAQKRFVAREDDASWERLAPGGRAKLFTRFTERARIAVAAAARAAQAAGAPEIQPAHLLAGALSLPEGIAARAAHRLGVSDEQVSQAIGVSVPAGEGGSDPAALRRLQFSGPTKEAMRAAVKAALRFGHNYIGTEHLLLGVLSADEETERQLSGIGLSLELVETALDVELAQCRLEKQQRDAT